MVPIPTEESLTVAKAVAEALRPIPENDRLGFLFGMAVGGMHGQGLSNDEIEKHVAKALVQVFAAWEVKA